MIDLTSIQEHYAGMPDILLEKVLKEDGMNLLPAPYAILKQEFEKRNLDTSLFDTIEQRKKELKEADIQYIKSRRDEERDELLWEYIMAEKESALPDSIVLQGLVERGLSQDRSAAMMTELPQYLAEKINKADTQIYIGIAVAVLGIFISITSYAFASQGGGYFFLLYGAVIFGIARAIKASGNKKNLVRLLDSIKQPLSNR